MNTSTKTLLSLTLLTTISAGTLRCMDLPGTLTPMKLSAASPHDNDNNVSEESLQHHPIVFLPKELKRNIAALCLASTLSYDFLPFKQLAVGNVSSIAFSPDGKAVLTESRDSTVCLWDVETGNKLKELRVHKDLIRSIAFSPDGKIVLAVSNDNTICLWDVETENKLKEFKGHRGYVCSVAYSPDGKTVLTGSDDTTACLWDVETGNILKEFIGHKGAVYSVAYSPDGKTVLTGADDRAACLWDVETGNKLKEFIDHKSYVISVAFSPDGKTIGTSSCIDETVILLKRFSDFGEWATTRKETAKQLFMEKMLYHIMNPSQNNVQ